MEKIIDMDDRKRGQRAFMENRNDRDQNRHVTVDEMLAFFCAKRIDADYMRLASKIHSHILACAECKKDYDTLLMADEALDKIIASAPHSQKADLREMVFLIRLKIRDFCELGWQAVNGRQYYHPAFAATSKSSRKGIVDQGVIRSTLVNEENDRISISPDHTLSLLLNKNECQKDTLVMLIPYQNSMQPYFQYTQNYDDETVIVRFENIEPGEYMVALKD